ncbi:MAG: MBL fold metallo-hydrolase, partial [Candidatus Omnitrophota bacterium]
IIMYIAGILMSQECVRAGSREFRITMIDVGQGDSTFIEFEDGKSMIIDAGPGAGFDCGRSVIAPFLKSKGVRSIDALIITHPQDDHMGGIGSLQEIFRVKRVYLAAVFKNNKYVRHLIKDKILDPERMGWLSAGDRLEGFGGTQIDTIHPPYRGESEDVNESSLVLRMRHSDLTALFCADIKDKTMTRLAASERYIRADILKVPHHGARLKNGGRSFIEQVCPRLSLISVGEHNRFGHPSPETITALENINANTVFRTDLDGAVEINLEPPSGIKVQSFYSKKILRWPLRPSLSL